MIRYALACDHAHPFEAWFGSSADYDDQAARGLVECPFCGSRAVSKQIMAPAVAGTKKRDAGPDLAQVQTMMMQAAREVRSHVEANFDYVGDSFAREARDIHEGRSETPRDLRRGHARRGQGAEGGRRALRRPAARARPTRPRRTDVAETGWRSMTVADLDRVAEIAVIGFPDHFEGRPLFANRLVLNPAGCFVLQTPEGLEGYLVTYPWQADAAPPLNTLIEAIPTDAGVIYLHDLALTPAVAGSGLVETGRAGGGRSGEDGRLGDDRPGRRQRRRRLLARSRLRR